MTFGKSIILLVYTAIVMGANPVMGEGATYAELRENLDPDLAKLTIHKSPKALSDMMFLDNYEQPINLEAYRGQTLLVNFWATWCGPCRVEMPGLDRLESHLGDGFKVITIAAGRNPPEMIEKFFEREGIKTLPRFRDPKMTFARSMDVSSLPVSVIINAKGQEIARVNAEMDWDDPRLISVLQALKDSGE